MGNVADCALDIESVGYLGILEEVHSIYHAMKYSFESLVGFSHSDRRSYYSAEFTSIRDGKKFTVDYDHLNKEVDYGIANRLYELMRPFYRDNFPIFLERSPLPYLSRTDMLHSYRPYSIHFDTKHPNQPDKAYYCQFKTFVPYVEYYCAVALMRQRLEIHDAINVDDAIQVINKRISNLVSFRRRIDYGDSVIDLNSSKSLTVYKSLNNISCKLYNHSVVPSVVYVSYINAGPFRLTVHKCETCGKLFIGEQTLKLFTENYGDPLFHIEYDSSYDHPLGFDGFNVESKLHSLGYNVVRGGMDSKQRFLLLSKLIKEGAISYFEVCRSIENNIDLFENNPRFTMAVAKWKEDLHNIAQSDLGYHK